MMVKTLELDLSPQQAVPAGWYYDWSTGQRYYVDDEGRRYVYAAGFLYPMHTFEPAPKTVTLAHGDKLRIMCSFKYSGSAKTCRLYGVIGDRRTFDVFDEVGGTEQTTPLFTLPQSSYPVTYQWQVDLPISVKPNPGGVLEGSKHYSIYAKLINGISMQEGVTGSVAYENAIFVVSAQPTFSDFKIYDYKKV